MAILSRLGNTVSGKFILVGGGHVLGAMLGFLATVIMVRALGDSGFAPVAIALSIQGYAFSIVSFGTELYAAPQLTRNPDRLGSLLALTTMLRLIMAVPATAILIGLGLTGVFGPVASLAIFCISTSTFFFALFPLWTAMALERPGFLSAVLFGGQVVILGITLVADAMDAAPWAFVLPKVISDLVMAIAAFYWARHRSGPLNLTAGARGALKEFRLIAPLGFSQLLRSALVTLDVAILGLFAAAPEVGKYAVAFRIYLFIFSIGSRYFVIILPIFSRQVGAGAGLLQREVRLSLIRSVPVYLLGLTVTIIYAPALLELVFGPGFADVAPVLRILTVAVTINFIHQTYRQVLLAAGAHKVDFQNNVVAVVIKLSSILVLAPAFGMTGAAIAMVLGDLTLLFLQKRSAEKIL